MSVLKLDFMVTLALMERFMDLSRTLTMGLGHHGVSSLRGQVRIVKGISHSRGLRKFFIDTSRGCSHRREAGVRIIYLLVKLGIEVFAQPADVRRLLLIMVLFLSPTAFSGRFHAS